ncbi:hypothetical protein DUI87_03324 [Hirundo rustica rustica]|uniref:Core shell protein Gag P30 domain-containing protein n=1 Tax=Hirundo rustica rustica TaxID=333673 RepID=A0A3M0L9S4_HIRRU|nr:hypothetical protein DUI87_03324 [Hirundo rustica rustica]
MQFRTRGNNLADKEAKSAALMKVSTPRIEEGEVQEYPPHPSPKEIEGYEKIEGQLEGEHATSYGFFANPHAVHELAEWRKYGDKLWELVLDDDKPAKKISKFWKIVQNELLKCEAEKQAVVAAKEAQGKNKIYYGHPSDPNPPGVAFVDLPPLPPPPMAPPLPSNADPLSPTPPDPPATEPFPGALSDLAEAMAQGRRETWAALAQQGWQREDSELAAAAQEQIDTCTFPVIFQPNAQGGQRAELVNLDWKLLSQLRATVASYGVTSEPAKQMLEFLFNANLLLPSDIRGISKLIYTPHQRLLFEARWREEAAVSAALPRPQGDPLTGLTMDELMGQGPFHRIEAQVALGQEKLREAMAVARRAMGKIRAPGGTPIYMGIKQGRDEPLGSFVDKIIEALSKADTAIRTAEKGWTHTSRVKKVEPREETAEWKVTSPPGDLKLTLRRPNPHKLVSLIDPHQVLVKENILAV